MDRISFDSDGNIVVETDTYCDKILSGIVLLTPEQANESRQHGWEEDETTTREEIEQGLRRVRKDPKVGL